jgi:ribosomal-protein-alanine N-acetyltransferase
MNAPTRELLKVHVRWMTRSDMPEVLAVERASFPHPWTEDDFLEALRHRKCIGMVAEHGEKVVGYMLYELKKHSIHVLNFAVAPGARRMGVGAQMAAKLVAKLPADGRSKVTACVREHNDAAIRFWAAVGFTATGVLRDYYGGEDAIRFKYEAAPVAETW